MPVMKVALVTASSAGLGAAIAKQLATDMRVVINYHSNEERAKSVLAELSNIADNCPMGGDPIGGENNKAGHATGSSTAPRFIAIRADLGQRSSITQLVSETIKVMGRLDVVVSNGGWTKIRNFSDLEDNVEEDDWNTCFNINVKSHLFLFHAAREYLSSSEGAFITTASVAGVKPSGSSLVCSCPCSLDRPV